MLHLLYDEKVEPFPKLNPEQHTRFRRKLLRWFRFYKRDLPWRTSRDPYRVWVSEVMLQQTRVAAVEERYVQFMYRFPTVQALAEAPLDDVLAMWSGLGYYRRARMMHQAARKIVSERGGVLPETSAQWRELSGIGRYTAAAIASIAFNEPVAVVDGNVERVLARVYGRVLPQEEVWDIANALLSRHAPGDFNQAMMELGATVCSPKSPSCLTCPVREFCVTQGEHATVSQAERRKCDVAYALATQDNKVALVQRAASESLMAGMWELPPAQVNGHAPLLTVKHSITNTDYTVRVFRTTETPDAVRWCDPQELLQLPLTGLARKVLRRVEII